MDFQTLLERLRDRQCPRWSDRQRRLHALDLVRRARHYYELEELKDFDNFRSEDYSFRNKGYVKIADRRPAAEYRLPAIITRDTVAQMFSESTFPTIVFEDETATDAAKTIIDKARLFSVMHDAATIGASGSVCIVPEVFPGDGADAHNLFVDKWKPYECEPVFKRNNPGVLDHVARTWKVTRESLAADGYDLKELEEFWRRYLREKLKDPSFDYENNKKLFVDWYIRRELNESEGVWYLPTPLRVYHRKDWDDWQRDDGRSTQHDLGFCPAIWVVNLTEDVFPDGFCTFEGSINNEFVIDRVLSVGQQAIITAGMPQLAIANPGGQKTFGASGDTITPGPLSTDLTQDAIIEVEETGGAWLVQMSAESTSALELYIKLLRSLSIENCAGSRASEESTTGKESGYAMELLNQSLVWLGGHLRHAWGEPGLVATVLMIGALHTKYPITTLKGVTLASDAKLKEISWGPYYEPSGQDKLAEVQAAQVAQEIGAIDHETVVANIGPLYDVVDIQGMVAKTKDEMDERAQQEVDAQVAVVKAKGESASANAA